MSISPCSVHDENSGVFANCLGKGFGAGLDDDISPTDFARQRCVQWWTPLVFSVLEFWNDDIVFQTGFTLRNR